VFLTNVGLGTLASFCGELSQVRSRLSTIEGNNEYVKQRFDRLEDILREIQRGQSSAVDRATRAAREMLSDGSSTFDTAGAGAPGVGQNVLPRENIPRVSECAVRGESNPGSSSSPDMVPRSPFGEGCINFPLMWKEWTVGCDARKSVLQSNRLYGDKWRAQKGATNATYQRYMRRKRIFDFVSSFFENCPSELTDEEIYENGNPIIDCLELKRKRKNNITIDSLTKTSRTFEEFLSVDMGPGIVIYEKRDGTFRQVQ